MIFERNGVWLRNLVVVWNDLRMNCANEIIKYQQPSIRNKLRGKRTEHLNKVDKLLADSRIAYEDENQFCSLVVVVRQSAGAVFGQQFVMMMK
jgi:hypothetical protein